MADVTLRGLGLSQTAAQWRISPKGHPKSSCDAKEGQCESREEGKIEAERTARDPNLGFIAVGDVWEHTVLLDPHNPDQG